MLLVIKIKEDALKSEVTDIPDLISSRQRPLYLHVQGKTQDNVNSKCHLYKKRKSTLCRVWLVDVTVSC